MGGLAAVRRRHHLQGPRPHGGGCSLARWLQLGPEWKLQLEQRRQRGLERGRRLLQQRQQEREGERKLKRKLELEPQQEPKRARQERRELALQWAQAMAS